MTAARLSPTEHDVRFAFRMLLTFAPTVQALVLVWLVGAINLFWSSVFGLGGHLVEWCVPHEPHSPLHLFGLFVWPVIVWLGLHRLGDLVWRLPPRRRAAAIAAYLATLGVVVPMDGVLYGPLKWNSLPLFIRLWIY